MAECVPLERKRRRNKIRGFLLPHLVPQSYFYIWATVCEHKMRDCNANCGWPIPKMLSTYVLFEILSKRGSAAEDSLGLSGLESARVTGPVFQTLRDRSFRAVACSEVSAFIPAH
jgi:hypothetical protein